MTSSLDLTFSLRELSHLIFLEASQERAPELLKCRYVSHTWKTQCDKLLECMWKNLKGNPPQGEVNISWIIDKIDNEIPVENSPVKKFKKLADVFRKYEAEIPKGSMPASIGEFQMLQKEIYDKALKTIWSCRLRALILQVAIVPPSDTSAEEIRKFLIDPVNNAALTHITGLNLDNLNLKAVPPELNRLSGLLRLWLANNQLSSVPNFAHFQNLQELWLNNNQLSSVPDFSHLQNLQKLWLNNNQLGSVPDFSHLQNLQRLWLYNNQLSSVPDFSHLQNLQWLSLGNNQLSSVPDFAHLQNLLWLSLAKNQLSSVPDFAHLKNLEKLWLNNNRLGSVLDFTHLHNLQGLSLADNQLGSVPDFAHLQNLQELSLANNHLSGASDFAHLQKLEELLLTGNRLM
jgi:Leucine-rich repeat (LRR) protein